MKFSDINQRQQSTNSSGHLFHIDLPMLIGLLTLSMTGLLILYSASGQDVGMLQRQGIRLGMGFVVMAFLAQISPINLLRWTPWLYGIGVILLILVLVMGDVGKGAQRWLEVGGFRFQPSELMKLTVPMMVAWYMNDKPLPCQKRKLLIASLFIIIPVLLVARQPDLGTSLLIASAGIFVLLLTGVHIRLVFTFIALAAACAPVLWYFMHDYQRQRVMTFLNPEQDPLGAGYHIIQSKIAIGSGGFYGKGWFNGTQSQLDFLPERSTDFIFAVFAEEFGFVGICMLLMIYIYIVARGLYMAVHGQQTFDRLVAGSLVFTFFIYVFVNIGMVSGILPVVGVPLPLISYGGTSVVTLMASFGILMSVHTHRKLYST